MTYSPGPDRQLPQDPFGPTASGAPDQPPTAQQLQSDTALPPPKRPGVTTGGWLLIGFGVLAAAALLIVSVAAAVTGYSLSRSNHLDGPPTPATTTGAPADVEPSAHTVGEAATLNGNGTRATIKVSDPINRRGSTGDTYLVVTVDIAVQSGSLVYSPLLFDLKDPSGALHGAAFDGAFNDELGTGDVQAGHNVHGTIPFKVPPDFLHGSEIELIGYKFETLGSWKLP
jgi:hypothetical protein